MTEGNSLQIEFVSTQAGLSELHLAGALDERVQGRLPELPRDCNTMDLSKITRVSSSGAELWVRWIRSMNDPRRPIDVQRISPSFIRILNTIDEMLPLAWEISSFFVPHVSVSTGNGENVLFLKDRHFTKKEILLSPLISSPIDGLKLELDVDPKRYFRFLQVRFPDIQIRSFS